jgi:hypothetical protein
MNQKILKLYIYNGKSIFFLLLAISLTTTYVLAQEISNSTVSLSADSLYKADKSKSFYQVFERDKLERVLVQASLGQKVLLLAGKYDVRVVVEIADKLQEKWRYNLKVEQNTLLRFTFKKNSFLP